ncbi:hypothetical protein [Streptomyces sp. NBC_00388]|uniref:hypothetical protein n=1 Tax=Streptomyces sp. NBC_00388 TaxID=2975735 RepID=UPI002E1C0C10
MTHDALPAHGGADDRGARARTGAAPRHRSGPGGACGDPVYEAARPLLDRAGRPRADAPVLATAAPGHPCPGAAPVRMRGRAVSRQAVELPGIDPDRCVTPLGRVGDTGAAPMTHARADADAGADASGALRPGGQALPNAFGGGQARGRAALRRTGPPAATAPAVGAAASAATAASRTTAARSAAAALSEELS